MEGLPGWQQNCHSQGLIRQLFTLSTSTASILKPCTIRVQALVICFLLLSIGSSVRAQQLSQGIADNLLQEGYELYQLQLAGVYSSRFIESNLSTELLTGTIVYPTADTIQVLYLSGQGKKTEVKYHFTFDRPVSDDFIRLAPSAEKMSDEHKKMIRIRQGVLKQLNKNKTLLDMYQDHPPSLVYLNSENFTEVFLFSGREAKGAVPLGNDCRMVFSPKGKFKELEKLHQNFIPIPGSDESEGEFDGYALSSMHVHSEASAPFITSTDIATILLYGNYVQWKSHLVFSDGYVTFMSIPDRKITIMLKEEFDRINSLREKEMQEATPDGE